jgi:hypothetical protein
VLGRRRKELARRHLPAEGLRRGSIQCAGTGRGIGKSVEVHGKSNRINSRTLGNNTKTINGSYREKQRP